MEIGLGTEVHTSQSITAQMIEAIQILGLSTQELDQRIQSELEANPALELEEAPFCPRCGAALQGNACLLCGATEEPERQMLDDFDPIAPSVSGVSDDGFDPMALIASDISLVEQILVDVATAIAAADIPIAEYLLNSLDDHGFLAVPLDLVAGHFARPLGDIKRILKAIQAVAPIGIAARDVRECLLLQVDQLVSQPGLVLPDGVRQVISNHLDDLAGHRYGFIAKQLGMDVDNVMAAHAFIRTQLHPYPVESHASHRWKTPVRTPVVAPDVVVYHVDDTFHIEVVESRMARIRLDPLYVTLAADAHPEGQAYSMDDGLHVRRHVNRARFFLSAIHQRNETLKRITTCLLELQRDFVLGGVRDLQPLTRCMVAERIGVHESTVSRASAKKYIMLPNRHVIPFSTFFTASLSTMDVIKELIQMEHGALTDEQLCVALGSRGIRIARRTVAKYRAALGILPSTLRASVSRQSA